VLALAYPARSGMNGLYVMEQVIYLLSAIQLLATLGDEPSTDLVFAIVISIYIL